MLFTDNTRARKINKIAFTRDLRNQKRHKEEILVLSDRPHSFQWKNGRHKVYSFLLKKMEALHRAFLSRLHFDRDYFLSFLHYIIYPGKYLLKVKLKHIFHFSKAITTHFFHLSKPRHMVFTSV